MCGGRGVRVFGSIVAGVGRPRWVILGVLCAVGSVLVTGVRYSAEGLADRIRVYEPLKPVLGAVGLGLVGIVGTVGLGTHGMPNFFGNGAVKKRLRRGL